MGDTNAYKYVAFISYTTKDMRWAKWIWKKLDRYVMPSSLHKDNSSLPNNLRPIFWDQTEYTAVSESTEKAGKLWPTLKQELDRSDNLIVICSPNSANAYWVNREVVYFIESGRENHIIPIIVDGTPHASDPSKECMPRALQVLRRSEEIVGFPIEKYGKVGVFSRVVSRILNVELAEIEQRERKRFWINKAKIAAPAAAGFICIGAYVWYVIPHASYYWSYIYKNEIPVGQCPILKEERSHACSFYKIVTQKGKVKEVERVNSAGRLVDNLITNFFDDPAKLEYTYDDNNRLVSVTMYDTTEKPLITKIYSSDLRSVDYVNPYDTTQPMALPADLMSAESAETKYQIETEKSAITRQILEHNKDGSLVNVFNMMNNSNSPVCDINGSYGKHYDYDDQGRIECCTNLGKDGLAMRTQYGKANIIEKFEYDEKGRVRSGSTYDADEKPVLDYNGVFKSEIRYDENGNPERLSRYGTDNQPIIDVDGIAFEIVRYDKNGFVSSYQCYDKEEQPSYFTDGEMEGISEVRVKCDADGNMTKFSFYDTDGQPVNSADGIGSCVRTYDKQGKILTDSYYDADGEPAYLEGLRVSSCSFEYNDNNQLKSVCYYDGEGNPVLSGYGYSKYVKEYNEWGLLDQIEIMDLSGKKTDLYEDAQTKYEYDSRGYVSSVSSFDKEGKPHRNKSGYFSVEYEYDHQYGNQISECYYDENGNRCYTYDGYYSKKVTEYNELGRPKSFRYYDKEDRPIRVGAAYEERMEYDELGREFRHSYYDLNGELTTNAEGYAILECDYDYDIRGKLTSNRYMDQNRELLREERTSYDGRGNLLEKSEVEYGAEARSGFSTFYEYDDYGNCRLEYYTDADGNPVPGDGDAEIVRNTYNEKNQRIKLEYLDHEYNPTNGKHGFSVQKFEYNEKNQRKVARQYEVKKNGEEVWRGYVTYRYNEFGDEIEKCEYDVDGNHIVKKVCKYDFMGNPTQIIYYSAPDVDAKELEKDYRLSFEYIPENHTVTRTYYAKGSIVETRIDFNDNDDNLLFSKLSFGEADFLYIIYSPVVDAAGFDQEGQAAALGIVPGDVILQYGDWKYTDYEKPEEVSLADFKYEWLSKENASRTIKIMHDDDSIDEWELKPGNAGFTYTISSSSLARSREIMKTEFGQLLESKEYVDILLKNNNEQKRLDWSGPRYSE